MGKQLFDTEEVIPRGRFIKKVNLASASVLLLAASVANYQKGLIPVAHAGTGESLNVGVVQTIPVIDGLEAGEEWVKDTMKLKLVLDRGIGEAFFRAKHDENYLYIQIDDLSNTNINQTYFSLAFDRGRDGIEDVDRPDDLIMLFSPLNDGFVGVNEYSGKRIPYVGEFRGRWGLGPSSNSVGKHLQYELAIPLQTLKESSNQTNLTWVGFTVAISGRACCLVYPTWGLVSMVFLDAVIPEFSYGRVFEVLVASLGLGMVARYLLIKKI